MRRIIFSTATNFSSIKALEPAREQFWNLIVENLFPKTMVNPELLLQFADKSSNLTLIGSIFLFVTAIMMIMSILMIILMIKKRLMNY